MPRRKRRNFTPELRADAVRMVREAGNLAKVTRELDLTETALRKWVQRAEIDEGRGPEGALTTEEREDYDASVGRTARSRWSATS